MTDWYCVEAPGYAVYKGYNLLYGSMSYQIGLEVSYPLPFRDFLIRGPSTYSGEYRSLGS